MAGNHATHKERRHESPQRRPADYTFDELVNSNKNVEWLRRKRNSAIIQVLIVLCVVSALILLLMFPTMQFISAREQERVALNSQSHVAAWPRGKIAEEYNAAQAYNDKLAHSDQRTLGEFIDPFASGGAGQTKPKSETDNEYQSLLNEGSGIMGIIRIPKISVRLPIYHGTSDKVLEHGAGHLYGTSLPVGGKSTNAVLSGHRGLPGSLLFTRLDELKKGDIFYIQTLNRTLGYRVESIHVIDPSDVHLYKIKPGRDLVTLMTCTPYGINTERLIITGTRQSIPDPIPDPDNAGKDPLLLGLLAFLCLLILGLIWLVRNGRNHEGFIGRHIALAKRLVTHRKKRVRHHGEPPLHSRQRLRKGGRSGSRSSHGFFAKVRSLSARLFAKVHSLFAGLLAKVGSSVAKMRVHRVKRASAQAKQPTKRRRRHAKQSHVKREPRHGAKHSRKTK